MVFLYLCCACACYGVCMCVSAVRACACVGLWSPVFLLRCPGVCRVQVLVGARPSSMSFHVFEMTYQLPRFAMFSKLRDVPRTCAAAAWWGTLTWLRAHTHGRAARRRSRAGTLPAGGCTFMIAERVARVVQWIEKAFITPNDDAIVLRGGACLRACVRACPSVHD